MIANRFNILCLISSCFFFSCGVKKFIPEEELLYRGGTVNIADRERVKDEKKLIKELENLLRPVSNRQFMGIPFRLGMHYRASGEKRNFINRFLNKRFGEPPVYLSHADPERNKQILINRVENKGYFRVQATHRIDTSDNRRARITYTLELKGGFVLNQYTYERTEVAGPDELIETALAKTPLKQGDGYDLTLLKQERERIAGALLENGYYNFSPELLMFSVDTTSTGEQTFDLYLRIKADVPAGTLRPYRISDIYIYPDYSLQPDADSTPDTVRFEDYHVIQTESRFSPRRFGRYLLFKPGDIYRQSVSDRTRQRMFSIGAFGFVNLRYRQPEGNSTDTTGHIPLDAHLYLSPLTKYRVQSELQAISKSNNFMGPLLRFEYRNRNVLRGGEQLTLGGHIGYETQVAGGRNAGLSAYEAGIFSELSIPRIIAPFTWEENIRHGVPRTKFSLSLSILNRVNFYQLQSLSFGFGYLWNASRYAFHEIKPVALNFTRLAKTSDAFEEILDANVFLRQSFEQRFIPGLEYSFTYNDLSNINRPHHVLVILRADLAGNLIYLGQKTLGAERPGALFGREFAMFARLDADLRYYRQIGKTSRLVLRLFGGVGKPLGNSHALPFIKQYFSGGPNSVRSFRIRSLGPGTYRPDTFDASSFFDQSGDIRIEANIELRFPLSKHLKGAVFTDAGNTWLYNENTALPGGRFSSGWIGEAGIGAGIGLRLDIDFFLVRLDLATPLRKPWLPPGERWISVFNPGDKAWRRENLVWNIAIGYPF